MSHRHPRKELPVITAAPRVVVVGHCGSGKSTLVSELREHGIDAVASAQEHSVVADLWRRRKADLLIYLDVDLETVRRRRGNHWPESLYQMQESRLARARQWADAVIDTGARDLSQTIAAAEGLVDRWRQSHQEPIARSAD